MSNKCLWQLQYLMYVTSEYITPSEKEAGNEDFR